MKILLDMIYHISGQIYVPKKVKHASFKILHISDTPSIIYSSIIKLVKKIRPDILIHTGDIVDDVKLEILPGHVDKYIREANYFIECIRPHVKERLVIVPGNHDMIEKLNLFNKVEVIGEGKYIEHFNLRIGLAHKYENLPIGCDFYLYGHDKKQGESLQYLNGINSINIINGESMEVTRLNYPMGTDDFRLRKVKLGI